MRKFKKQEEDAEVNMTPMLDIVFIMLIFFIVTATFVKEAGIEINTPPPDIGDPPPPPDEECKRAIAFIIDDSNRIRNDGRNIGLGSVEAIIKRRNVACPEAPVVVQAADDADFGNALRIYDMARAIGLPREQVLISPER